MTKPYSAICCMATKMQSSTKYTQLRKVNETPLNQISCKYYVTEQKLANNFYATSFNILYNKIF